MIGGILKQEKSKLTYEKTNFWKNTPEKEKKEALTFAEKYKKFLSECKTVRETIRYTEEALTEAGFVNVENIKQKTKKFFSTYRGKSLLAVVIGKEPVVNGINIIAPHIDTPRIDLKQNPLYEDSVTGLAMMRTHYYGGIKKYQWMSTPLALHGIIIKNDGEIINVCIGESDDDPIFIMPDLLPHLAAEQYKKTIGEAINASNMNVIFSSIPCADEKVKEAFKHHALMLLNEKYGITEADFLSAELELVPAGKARCAGIDRSMVAGYGHDDRVCSFTALEGLMNADSRKMQRTSLIFFSDKEEIGSEGNTGAKAIQLVDFIGELLKANGEEYNSYAIRKTLINSQILSADVNAAINPNFPSVHEKDNAVIMGNGVSVTKFTGARGKAGANDANAEFTAKVIRLFNKEKVNWQMAALGQVDVGGGGTVAKFLAAYGAEVIDCGTGVVGMHSPCELISKADLYSTFKAYKVFLEKG